MGMLLTRHYRDTKNDKADGAAEKVAPKEPLKKKTESKPEVPKIEESELKRMNGTKLRKLAAENGIASPEELTVGEIRAILIEKLC